MGIERTLYEACRHWVNLQERVSFLSGDRLSRKVSLKVHRVSEDAYMPVYKTDGASGFDLASCEDVEVAPHQRVMIRTGLKFEIPEGYEVQIRPRSGLALKGYFIMPNAPGTIDSDYRGEVGIILMNLSPYRQVVSKGERIAQGVLAPSVRANFVEVEGLSSTVRGSGGFGSTGV